MSHPLDNIFWNCLSGPQAHFAQGIGMARRYAKGFSPILGFAQAEQPDFAALAPYCDSGEQFYCSGWSGEMPDGWRLQAETTMYRMVWDGKMPDEVQDFFPRALDASHAQQAMALAVLTNPGPFGLRTLELGDYLGCFEGERLIAMAGERTNAEPYREVSGVCTHPEFQGRGLARRLMHTLIRRQLMRNEIPFLHVMCHNTSAHELYLRMGFRDYCKTPVRVIERL